LIYKECGGWFGTSSVIRAISGKSLWRAWDMN